MMVWGMTLPENFGEFWPDGEFERDSNGLEGTWYDRLTAYYMRQTPEEQKRLFDFAGEGAAHYYGTYPSKKFTSEPARGGGYNCPPFVTVEPHEQLKSFDTNKTYKELGAVIMLNDRILAIDQSLKSIIERLEPSIHQFYPFEIRMPGGALFPVKYYMLLIGQYFDAFSLEDSNDGAVDITSSRRVRLYSSKSELNAVAMRKSVFGNAHLCRDRQLGPDLTCFSDELHVEIKKAGLLMPRHFYQLKEV